MNEIKGKRIVVTGAGAGLGWAMARSFLARGAEVVAIARDAAGLGGIRSLGATTIMGDVTKPAVMDHIVADQQPDILVLNAGARLPMKPIDRQTWEDFSVHWDTDARATFVGIQAALDTPMRPGSRVVTMSSGAATVMSSPFIDPGGLHLSGGYVGAKRMVWYMAHQANSVSLERGLDIRFQVLVPGQVMPGTALGHSVAAAYGELEGVTAEQHVLARYGSILEPDAFGEMVADLFADPRYANGVAYGLRGDVGIYSMDLGAGHPGAAS